MRHFNHSSHPVYPTPSPSRRLRPCPLYNQTQFMLPLYSLSCELSTYAAYLELLHRFQGQPHGPLAQAFELQHRSAFRQGIRTPHLDAYLHMQLHHPHVGISWASARLLGRVLPDILAIHHHEAVTQSPLSPKDFSTEFIKTIPSSAYQQTPRHANQAFGLLLTLHRSLATISTLSSLDLNGYHKPLHLQPLYQTPCIPIRGYLLPQAPTSENRDIVLESRPPLLDLAQELQNSQRKEVLNPLHRAYILGYNLHPDHAPHEDTHVPPTKRFHPVVCATYRGREASRETYRMAYLAAKGHHQNSPERAHQAAQEACLHTYPTTRLFTWHKHGATWQLIHSIDVDPTTRQALQPLYSSNLHLPPDTQRITPENEIEPTFTMPHTPAETWRKLLDCPRLHKWREDNLLPNYVYPNDKSYYTTPPQPGDPTVPTPYFLRVVYAPNRVGRPSKASTTT